jgi:hypothetical protein
MDLQSRECPTNLQSRVGPKPQLCVLPNIDIVATKLKLYIIYLSISILGLAERHSAGIQLQDVMQCTFQASVLSDRDKEKNKSVLIEDDIYR